MSNSWCWMHTELPVLKLLKMQQRDLKEQEAIFLVASFTRLKNMQITLHMNLAIASLFPNWLIQKKN